MTTLFQVGAGSGGMPVLDMLSRDPRLTQITLVEPDVYKAHNVERHLFPLSDVGRLKADLARDWLLARRPDLEVRILTWDLTDPAHQADLDDAVAAADLGVCAADNETAKYHFDAMMRRHGKPWTLGEVLAGGIGGFVHRFVPDGPCYGCVASHLQRGPRVDASPPPDYSHPNGAVEETRIPASMASIHTVASLHALWTLGLLDGEAGDPGCTSLLLTFQRVPEVFDEVYRPIRFRVSRAEGCLVCQARPAPSSGEELDVALDEALARLAGA
jgi:molybdopterin/thiamine biosynthesis adenylyltransferase